MAQLVLFVGRRKGRIEELKAQRRCRGRGFLSRVCARQAAVG